MDIVGETAYIKQLAEQSNKCYDILTGVASGDVGGNSSSIEELRQEYEKSLDNIMVLTEASTVLAALKYAAHPKRTGMSFLDMLRRLKKKDKITFNTKRFPEEVLNKKYTKSLDW